jgi:hypothetical protein
MKTHAYTALATTVGSVQPVGAGSFDLTTWEAVEGSRTLRVWAGEWSTEFAGDRRIRMHYWTERYRGLRKPGRLHLRVEVFTRDGIVADPARARSLTADLVEKLR